MANNDEKATWSTTATNQLINYLYNYTVENGSRQPEKKDWELWTSELSPHFTIPLTVGQVKGKRDRLKKNYDVFLALKKNTGLGWDPVTQIVTCSNEFWKDYVKRHPKAKNFRNGGLDNEDLLAVIFGRGHATGAMAYGSGSGDAPRRSQSGMEYPVDDSIPLDSDDDSPPYHTEELDVPPSSRPGPSIANSSKGIGKKSARSKRKGQDSRALDCLQLIAESMSGGKSVQTPVQQPRSSQEATGPTLLQRCQQILHEMNIDDHLYNLALDGFMDNPSWREVFVTMEPQRRQSWLYYKVYPTSTATPSQTHNTATPSNDHPYYPDTRRYF